VTAGHSGQFTPMRLPVNTVIHTTLAGIEPTTFRLLVRRATSNVTECSVWYHFISFIGIIIENNKGHKCDKENMESTDSICLVEGSLFYINYYD